jgi:hypothetical protein
MHAAARAHLPDCAPADVWNGSETGMAADTLALTPLIEQQNVPNMQQVNHAPQTQVIPELEQGEGRAPGWKWGWMRKNIPYAPEHIASHSQRNFGKLRDELPLGYETTRKLNRPSQSILEHHAMNPPASLEQPHTVYNVASEPTLPTWGEPL